MECPTCLGSGYEDPERAPKQVIRTGIPHSSFGGNNCRAFLTGYVRVEMADIICNDCDGALKTVPAEELQRTLDEMEMSLEFCTVLCPHCGSVNLFLGFSEMQAYTCDECLKEVGE
jgi:hypothetical protein